MSSTRASRAKRPRALSHGRPSAPSTNNHKGNHKSKALAALHTRRLIRQHHNFNKQRAAAVVAGDDDLVKELDRQIEAAGGLSVYQNASILGQSRERGGDASSILVHWLGFDEHENKRQLEDASIGAGKYMRTGNVATSNRPIKPRMLDVGALTTDTAASRCGCFEQISRIDLRSQCKEILEQDFMQRPLPKSDLDQFDVISLSLVLNYIPQARVRGEMLKRVSRFLRQDGVTKSTPSSDQSNIGRKCFPCLFIVLPAPCVINSRYLTEERFEAMLEALGYSVKMRKISAKLIYFLCVFDGIKGKSTAAFSKVEIRPGKGRNNFAIIIEPD